MRNRIRRLPRPTGSLLRGVAAMVAMLAVILLIPAILVNRFEGLGPGVLLPLQPKEPLEAPERSLTVRVFLTKQQRIVDLPLEEYVRGVVAAEMPADFELEALKAQAIAARTYLVRRLAAGRFEDMPEGAEGAVVTDTVQHQAFATLPALRERWGMFGYAKNLDKLTRAVNETAGLVLTYDGEPIQATFFSASNGFTENSELYWKEQVPYLRSVASPWDESEAPAYRRDVDFAYAELYRRLGLKDTRKAPDMKVKKTSESGRILEAVVNGKTFTGRELRERLGLASTDFEWRFEDGNVRFTTYGSGHGVGMSQWGANGMAKEGKTAEQILLHYYTGVRLETLDRILPNRSA